MPSVIYSMVQQDLEDVIGDILSVGILNKGLAKAGAIPEEASLRDMDRAFQMHIEKALVSFMGPKEAHFYVQRLQRKLESRFQGGA